MSKLSHVLRLCYGPECRHCARTVCPICGGLLKPSAVHFWFGDRWVWGCRAIIESVKR